GGDADGSGTTGKADGADDGAGSTGTTGDTDTTKPKTRTVTIDYTTDENRAKVLKAAQRKHLLPKQHTSFNEKGQAVYKVQSGDSYWRIADMSDGKPSDQFDFDHFRTTLNVNSKRFGRSPESGLIHPGEKVLLKDRSIDDLVKLLGLPTTYEEEIPAEDLAPRRTNPNHPTPQ
ncbi:MAG: hypothetical protein KDC46_03830, partial [Thermoleophilia bacterium]|nr:hypothetical protein [Thermoleophilia bacterium]